MLAVARAALAIVFDGLDNQLLGLATRTRQQLASILIGQTEYADLA